uniref:Uncharacterized protein n=1 Tax=Solanum tuberosum TaxID=4113 RepID=M1AN70_SOLTU
MSLLEAFWLFLECCKLPSFWTCILKNWSCLEEILKNRGYLECLIQEISWNRYSSM